MFKQIRNGLLLSSAMMLILAGCSSGNSATSSPATDDSKSGGDVGKEAVTIRVMTRYAGSDPTAKYWQDAEKAYMDKNPNVKIVDEFIGEETAYNNKFKIGLATGDLPAIFIVYSKNLQVEYAKSGQLMDLTSVLAEDKAWSDSFNSFNLNEYKFDQYGVNGTYGIPLFNAIEMFYYNTDLFTKAGITKTPDTYEEFMEDIKLLKSSGTVPWLVSAKDTWRVQHIHNILMYKTTGVQQGINMGLRKAKWTDPGVVESFNDLKSLKTMGAFEPDMEGIDYETEKANFLSGKGAMMFDGSWFIAEVQKSELKDKVKGFLMPYKKDKPEYKDTNMVFTNNFSINAKLTPAQKEAAVGFAKFVTSKEYQENLVYGYQDLPVISNIQMDSSKVSPLFTQAVDMMKTIKEPGNDSFYYDPLASMQDKVRNSIIGLLLGNSADV